MRNFGKINVRDSRAKKTHDGIRRRTVFHVVSLQILCADVPRFAVAFDLQKDATLHVRGERRVIRDRTRRDRQQKNRQSGEGENREVFHRFEVMGRL